MKIKKGKGEIGKKAFTVSVFFENGILYGVVDWFDRDLAWMCRTGTLGN